MDDEARWPTGRLGLLDAKSQAMTPGSNYCQQQHQSNVVHHHLEPIPPSRLVKLGTTFDSNGTACRSQDMESNEPETKQGPAPAIRIFDGGQDFQIPVHQISLYSGTISTFFGFLGHLWSLFCLLFGLSSLQ